MKTIGRIQRLNDSAEDSFEVDDIPISDLSIKEKAMAIASNVSSNGKRFVHSNDTYIIKDSSRFVLESPLKEVDDAGIPIAVGFCGEIKGFNENSVLNSIRGFIHRSDRSISNDSLTDIRFCLGALAKAIKQKKQRTTIALALAILIIFIVAFLIIRR